MAASNKGFGAWFDERQAAGGAPPAGTVTSAAAAAATRLSAVGSALGDRLGSWTALATGAPAAAAGDIEAGGGPASSPPPQSPAADGSASSFLPDILRRSLPNQLGGTAAPPEWTCGLSATQRFQLFLLFAAGAAVLLSLSFFVFLPVVVLLPSKFASGITFGSLMLMTAFAFLRGPRATLVGFASPERRVFAAAYLGSLALTLYAVVSVTSYLLTLAATGAQLAALAWYGASFIPGGTWGMAVASRVAGRAVSHGARGIASALGAGGASGGSS